MSFVLIDRPRPGDVLLGLGVIAAIAADVAELADDIMVMYAGRVAEEGPVPSKTSWRFMTILTGRPLFLESTAATGSR